MADPVGLHRRLETGRHAQAGGFAGQPIPAVTGRDGQSTGCIHSAGDGPPTVFVSGTMGEASRHGAKRSGCAAGQGSGRCLSCLRIRQQPGIARISAERIQNTGARIAQTMRRGAESTGSRGLKNGVMKSPSDRCRMVVLTSAAITGCGDPTLLRPRKKRTFRPAASCPAPDPSHMCVVHRTRAEAEHVPIECNRPIRGHSLIVRRSSGKGAAGCWLVGAIAESASVDAPGPMRAVRDADELLNWHDRGPGAIGIGSKRHSRTGETLPASTVQGVVASHGLAACISPVPTIPSRI